VRFCKIFEFLTPLADARTVFRRQIELFAFVKHYWRTVMINRTVSKLVMIGALAVLASCGGGAGGGGISSGSNGTTSSVPPTAVAIGTVNGFGSVIVDGVRFDDSAATIHVEIEPGVLVPLRSRDLRLGQTATVAFSGDEANALAHSIRIAAEIVGSVEKIDAGKLVVSGQDVRTNADSTIGPVTVFDGYLGLADIKVGDRVEVHGTPQVDAVTKAIFVQATRIERRVDPIPFVRITGTIANLVGNTFDLGTMKVSFAGTTLIVPANLALANGQRVVVWTNTPVNGNTLTAKAIRINGSVSANAGSVRIAGPVTDCTAPCAASFKVNGLSIDASAARFDEGTAAQLGDGVFARIRGAQDATTGKVLASTVEFRARNELELDVRGTILGYVPGGSGAATFTVRGVPVEINGQTKITGCTSVLAEGIAVKVEGRVAGNIMLASQVRCLASLNSLRAEVRGLVNSFDLIAMTFQLDSMPGLTIIYNPTTTKFDGGTPARLVLGAFVEVEGTVTNGKLAATEIEFKRAPGARERSIKGVVAGFDAVTRTFKLGSLTIAVESAGLIPLWFADGLRVEVDFITLSGVNSAVSIERAK
jgi:Domain of unknown function (DUF5666)